MSAKLNFEHGDISVRLQKENHALAALKQKPVLELAGVLEQNREKIESTVDSEELAWQVKVHDVRNRNLQSLDTNQGFKFLAKLDDRHFHEITRRMTEKERETAMNYREVHKKGLHSDSWIDLRTGKLRVSLDKVGIESGVD